MPGKNSKKMIGACVVTAALLCAPSALKAEGMLSHYTCVADAIQKDNRPEPAKRLFRSQAVENEIIRVQKLLRNSKLAWMFTNCSQIHWIPPYTSAKAKTANPILCIYRRYSCHVAP